MTGNGQLKRGAFIINDTRNPHFKRVSRMEIFGSLLCQLIEHVHNKVFMYVYCICTYYLASSKEFDIFNIKKNIFHAGKVEKCSEIAKPEILLEMVG